MATVIVLAMHGAPPQDFPRAELREFFGLGPRIEQAPEAQRAALTARQAELDAKMRAWPRTAQNDPFFVGAQALGIGLARSSGMEVLLGFNEFCAPTLAEALDAAAQRVSAQQGGQVIVVTPMVTRGGEHSEVEIPADVQAARERHPAVDFRYAWPMDLDAVAGFLAGQVRRAMDSDTTGGPPRA